MRNPFKRLIVIVFISMQTLRAYAYIYTGHSSAPSDPQATKQTVMLFNYLKNISKTGMLFGQHHASVEAQNWKDDALSANFNSDVKTAVGDHPAVFGFDFSKGITKFKNHVQEIYRRGGIITYSWHCPNPVNNQEVHNKEGNPVTAILPGGQKHAEWLKKLDEIAAYFNSLEVNGIKVPVIFRPFHENTGGWFWWGAGNCTNQQYIQLWRMTIDYLRKEKGVHNMLLAYSLSKPTDDVALTKAMYPGDDYVDIIGMDIYGNNQALKQLLVDGCRFINSWAKKANKIPAITEIGIKKGLQNSASDDWFMSEFLNLIKNDKTTQAAYALTWKNTSPNSYWTPLPGQAGYASFVNFYKDPYTLFLNDLKNVYETDNSKK